MFDEIHTIGSNYTLNQTLHLFFSLYFIFFHLFFSCQDFLFVCEWWKEFLSFLLGILEDVGVFHEKGLSIVSLHAFQPFNSPLQMLITIKVNMPILTSNHIFPNKKGLKMLQKFVPKRKLISENIPNFQNSREEDVQVVSPFETQKKTLEKGCIQRKGGEGWRRWGGWRWRKKKN